MDTAQLEAMAQCQQARQRSNKEGVALHKGRHAMAQQIYFALADLLKGDEQAQQAKDKGLHSGCLQVAELVERAHMELMQQAGCAYENERMLSRIAQRLDQMEKEAQEHEAEQNRKEREALLAQSDAAADADPATEDIDDEVPAPQESQPQDGEVDGGGKELGGHALEPSAAPTPLHPERYRSSGESLSQRTVGLHEISSWHKQTSRPGVKGWRPPDWMRSDKGLRP